MDNWKNKLRNAISANKTQVVFRELQNIKDPDISNEVLLLSGRWENLKRNERLGIISSSNANLENNRIMMALLDILSRLTDDQLAENDVESIAVEGHSNIIYRSKDQFTSQSPTGVSESEPKGKTILFISATPRDKQVLRFDLELRKIKDSVRNNGNIRLEPEFAVRPDEVLRLLKQYRPEIVHLSMHGSSEKGLFFVDEQGEDFPISTDILASFFELINLSKRTVECLVLSACHSLQQARAVSQYVPHVIGMKDFIPDEASAEFAAGFYQSISDGDLYATAFKHGLLNIKLWLERHAYESEVPLPEVPVLFDPKTS